MKVGVLKSRPLKKKITSLSNVRISDKGNEYTADITIKYIMDFFHYHLETGIYAMCIILWYTQRYTNTIIDWHWCDLRMSLKLIIIMFVPIDIMITNSLRELYKKHMLKIIIILYSYTPYSIYYVFYYLIYLNEVKTY